ncbi:MAG: M28 family peptidase, partial [Flavobacteriaceae bacterium]|nr:M28 family peptidase [Flavobacteriaceae bacterium]
MKKFTLFILIFVVCFSYAQQQRDSLMLKSIYKTALLNGQAYDWLDYLTNQIGGRLSGSLNAKRAVEWSKEELEKLNLDRVWLQPVLVPKWVRGPKEFALIETEPGVTFNVPITALGGSVATPSVGLKAEVVEVQNFEELAVLGRENIDGKIVFFNRPMQADLISTFSAYGGCVNQRYDGARQASQYGAIGVIVRSMSLRMDDYPHTGAMSYGDQAVSKRIPAAAISTNAAEKLSNLLKIAPKLKFLFRQQCKQYEDVLSYNVIGEITGSTFPDEIILVGGHLDSWDIGDGAHDDGAGCVQSMEVLRLFKELDYKPQRT